MLQEKITSFERVTGFEEVTDDQIIAELPQIIEDYQNGRFKTINPLCAQQTSQENTPYFIPEAVSFREHAQLQHLCTRMFQLRHPEPDFAKINLTTLFDALTPKQRIRLSTILALSRQGDFDDFLADYYRSHPEMCRIPESDGQLMISWAIATGSREWLKAILEWHHSPKQNGRLLYAVNQPQTQYLVDEFYQNEGANVNADRCLPILLDHFYYQNHPEDMRTIRGYEHRRAQAQATQRTSLWGYPVANNSTNNRDNDLAKELMSYVLYPTEENLAKAKSLYTANPKLLFIETEGTEPASGVEVTLDQQGQIQRRVVHRKIKNTPFGAALGTGDSTLYNHMASVLDKIEYKNEKGEVVETGVQRALTEMNKRFPKGFDYPPCDDEFNQWMKKIIDAIENDPSLINNNIQSPASPATQALLAEFRKAFLPKDITQGHHFNLNYLIKAFEAFNQYWDNWNGNQLSLFFCQFIGFIERLVPVVDAQAFRYGLKHLLDDKQPEARSLSFYHYEENVHFSYFDVAKCAYGLGFDFGVEISSPGMSGSPFRGSPSAGLIKQYCGAKTSEVNNLKHRLERLAQPAAQMNPFMADYVDNIKSDADDKKRENTDEVSAEPNKRLKMDK